MHVALVQQDGDHLVLPRKRRPRGEDLERGEARGHRIDMPRMAVVEQDALAPRLALADAGEAAMDQHRNPGVYRSLVERVPDRVAGGIAALDLADDAEADEPGVGGGRALELRDPGLADLGVERQPVAEDRVAVPARDVEAVVVDLPDLVEIVHPEGQSEVEHGAHVVPAERVGHLLLGFELGGGAPDPFLAGALDRVLEDVAALGAPMRMAVEDPHELPRWRPAG